MSAWDKVFTGPAQAGEGQHFDALQEKYQGVIRFAEQQGIVLETLQLRDNRLLLRGISPTGAALDRLREQIKQAHPGAEDLAVEIRVEASAAVPPPPAVAGGQKASPLSQTVHTSQAGHTIAQSEAGHRPWQYTVKPGDTLRRLAERFYGDPERSTLIFEANRDQLVDPELIQVGQVLRMPPLEQ